MTNAEQRRVITDLQLEQRVVSMEAAVRLAYLGLVGAIEGRKVAESNLDIAETSLRQSKARVQVGQAPQIEIIQFEAQAATARERMIATEAEISTAEDNLRTLILDPARPDYWTVRLLPSRSDSARGAPGRCGRGHQERAGQPSGSQGGTAIARHHEPEP